MKRAKVIAATFWLGMLLTSPFYWIPAMGNKGWFEPLKAWIIAASIGAAALWATYQAIGAIVDMSDE
jgi:hypothetical protein